MKQLAQPLYTIESFINNLIGDEKSLKALEEQEGGELYLKWNGSRIHISPDKTFTEGLDTDRIWFSKYAPGVFEIDLDASNGWYMAINFSDGGLVKNRVYRVSDYAI